MQENREIPSIGEFFRIAGRWSTLALLAIAMGLFSKILTLLVVLAFGLIQIYLVFYCGFSVPLSLLISSILLAALVYSTGLDQWLDKW